MCAAADEKTAENQKEEPKLSYAEKRKQRVLDPSNPLLERFQKALKEHLLRHIDILKQDISEYETGASKKVALKEELGGQVYEEQQIVAKQQTTLDKCIKQLEHITAARNETEKHLQERREIHKQEQAKLIEAEMEEMKLKKEVESTNFLVYQLSQWENTIESDLNTKHRMLDKSNQDKRKLLKQKRIQDALVYRLTMRTWQLETEVEKKTMHIRVYKEEREQLAETVALGNINVEAVASENKNLVQAWNSVVVDIASRDKVVKCLNIQLDQLEQKFKGVLTQIERTKKLTEEEMRKNELLTLVKNRMIGDMANSKARMQEEMSKKTGAENTIDEMQGIIERTEADINQEIHDNVTVQRLYKNLTRELKRLTTEETLKDEIAACKFASDMADDNLVKSLRKELAKVQYEVRALNTVFAKDENDFKTILINREVQKHSNEQLRKYQEEIEKQIVELQNEAHAFEKGEREFQLTVAKIGRETVILFKQLEKTSLESGSTGSETLAENLRSSHLEKDIVDLNKEVSELKICWLKVQTDFIDASKERQRQIIGRNQLGKETAIMEQRWLKLLDIVNDHNTRSEKIKHDIHSMQNKLKNLSEKNFKDKGLRQILYKRNEIVQEQCVNRLKDVELECLALATEIDEIEEDKLTLSNDLIELNREALGWEKKFQLAKGTRDSTKAVQGHGGELNTLKADISRKTLIYNNLRKAQEKIITDLDHCVTRRDVIVTVAEAKAKRTKGAFEKTRLNFTRKLDNMRNRIEQIKHETEQFKKKKEHVELELRSNGYDVADIEKEIVLNKKTLEELAVELEESKTQRQLSFDLMLQLQKRVKLCNQIAMNHTPYRVYVHEWELSVNFTRHKDINMKLVKVLHMLQQEFPCYERELAKLLNILSMPIRAFELY